MLKILKVLWILMVPVALIVGFYFGALAGTKVERGRWDLPVLNHYQYTPGAPDTTRLVVYYAGGMGCAGCIMQETIDVIKRIKEELPDSASSWGMTTKFVCIAMDDALKETLPFAAKFGPWDEVHMGSHAWNEFLLANMYLVEEPAYPHLLIFRDRFVAKTDSVTFHYTDRELLADFVGFPDMKVWANRGYPMDGMRTSLLQVEG